MHKNVHDVLIELLTSYLGKMKILMWAFASVYQKK